jgi:thiol-disulfide isomerase/thioredoxin
MRLIPLVLAVFWSFAGLAQVNSQPIPGRLLLRLAKDAPTAVVQRAVQEKLPFQLGAASLKALGEGGRYHLLVVGEAGADPLRLQQLLKEVPGVEATQPDHYVQHRAQPNDPQYGSQWHLADMNVEPVWNTSTGGTMANGRRIAVGIIDSGVQGGHPDLAANMVFDAPAADEHGTEVAGVVGAVGNNAEGVSGVNWDVDLVSPATVNTLSDAFDQFQFCLNQRTLFNQSNGAQGRLIVALTISWGSPGVDCGFGEPIFDDLGAAGVLVVTSGPNDGTDIDVVDDYPGTCPNANNIVVTSYGPLNEVPYAVGDNTVHLLAPGLDIPTTTIGGSYATVNGNSFAIPNVAGAIALLYSNDCVTFAQAAVSDPQATALQVKQAILSSVSPFPGGNAITITGGKLNVQAAYQALAGQCAPCIALTVDLNTPAGTAAQYTLVNGLGNTVAQGSGASFTTCAQDGCFSGTVVDGAAQPLDGTFTVSLQGTVLHSGTIVNGALDFPFGTVVPGCTDPASGTYDPSANCDNGTCCSANTVTLYLIAQDEGATGSAQLNVSAGGTTLFNGPVTIAPQLGYGRVTVCAPTGCLTVLAQAGDVALQPSGFAEIPGGPFTEYFFAVGEASSIPVGGQATEVCDGADNDCDGLVDEGFTWYTDADGDGFGIDATAQVLCSPPNGAFAQQGGDCDDSNAAINPGMTDLCSSADGLDNDCNGAVDDADLQVWYPDADADGFGAELPEVIACEPPAGHVGNNADCDDGQSSVFPGATEVCDGLDNDCDGTVDEDFLWYTDADGDGFGDDSTAQPTCSPVPGAVQVGGDCDDTNAALQGGVTLFVVSEFGITSGSAHYVITQGSTTHEGDLVLSDNGADVAEGSVSVCLGTGCFSIAVTPNEVPLSELAFVQIALNPGQNGGFAVADGFFGSATPPVAETCDGLDNDCDGVADEDFLWYADMDGDGVGVASTVQFSCTPLPDHVQVPGDCNDADPNLTLIGAACSDGDPNTFNDIVRADCSCLGFVQGDCPPGEIADCNGNCAPAEWVGDGTCDDGAFEHNGIPIFFDCGTLGNDGGDCGTPCGPELCDALDNDCDGGVDEDFTWYVDADGDGYGASATAQVFCAPPSGRVQVAGDCDDTDATINPGATDGCDGIDRNCDGVIPGTNGTEVYSPNWTATATTGETVDLFALLAQGKTVVLDLFAAWCVPSQQMLSANFLQDWNAHMGPNGTDQIRIVAIAVDQSAGNVNPFISSAQWPVIVDGGESFGPLYNAIGMYNNFVPTLLMICPDRSVTMLYGGPDELPYTGLFQYDAPAAALLLNERCACRNACLTNIGCMDVNACDYDPTATCPGPCAQAQEWFVDNDGDGAGTTSLGTQCTQPANSAAISGDCDDNNASAQVGFTLSILTNDPGDFGTAHYLIQQGGTIIEGDLDLPAETEGIGELPVCIGSGCYTITITQNDVLLFQEAYLTFASAPDEPLPISVLETYVGGGSAEVCDGLDNDCDGQVDEGLPQEYADNDGDGFGNALQPLSCDTPGVANPDDCDDTNAAIFPGQGCGGCSPADIALVVSNTSPSQGCIQSCYGGAPNDLLTCLANCYVQAGFSNTCASCIVDFQFCTAVSCPECEQDPNSAACIQCRQNAGCDSTFTACSGLQDADGDGYFAPIDCDDANAAVHPNRVEGCTVDGLDNDCDGQVDEDALVDADGDGFSLCDGDCNDMNADVTPVAAEVCDGIDNNCNGTTDEGFPAYFVDNDGDGFGDPVIAGACGAPGSVPNNLDCDDAAATVYPGAPELCDELDNDCNGAVDDNLIEDLDNDGFTPCTGDCDDNNATVFPGAPELCDGIDNDCSGAIEPTLFADLDADGFGAAGIPVPCGTPGSPNQLDCDDSDPLVTLSPSWYPDADGDGYGVSGTTISACTQPTGYAGNSFDCDDNDPQVFPGQGCVECSPADLALMASDPGVISPSQFCSFSCASVPDQQQCLSACLAGNGLSDPCADCFAAYVLCQAATCPICLEQPQSPACIACQENNGCKEAFTACSGLEDADDDDYFVPFDCNDANAVVHPDAPELCDGLDNDCDGSVDEGCNVRISVKVLLEGPYDPGAGSMSDGMRALGLVPTTEPYTGLGYGHVGGGGESTSPALLATGGADAIVDWVLLELRAPEQPSVIVASRSALLRRDGQVVDVLGTGPVTMPIGAGSYHVAVRHRNHLGCMTDAPLALGPAGSSVDFSLGTTTTFGTNARRSITGAFPTQALWMGDVNGDNAILYTGAFNDRDPVLFAIGGTVPTNTVSGYRSEDVNLDGTVKYTGENNDRDPILQAVGGSVPTNVKEGSLP